MLKSLKPKFQVIFSDACHSSSALKFEFQQLLGMNLIETCFMAWDDCMGDMQTAFQEFAEKYQSGESEGLVCSAILSIHGWLGVNEHSHSTCVLTTIDLKRIRARDALFGSLNIIQPISCK